MSKNQNYDKSLYNLPFTVNSFNGMPYRQLGNSGLRVSNIGLGTWKIGYPETGDGSKIDESKAFDIFEKAIELGVTFWDTANRYNNSSGNSERIIGKWFTNNPNQRRNVILATKVFGTMDGYTPNHCGLSRSNIFDAVYASLDRLKIEYIDVLYFHSYDSNTPIEESLFAIEDLISRDLVRYFGVSNFTIKNLKKYVDFSESSFLRNKIVAVQNQYDILNGESSKYLGVFDIAKELGISFIGWSPLARGLISDKYLHKSSKLGDRVYDEGIMKGVLPEKLKRKLLKLQKLAENWNISLSQLALSYMLHLPGMGPVIPSTSSIFQLEQNAQAGKISLDRDKYNKINNIIIQ